MSTSSPAVSSSLPDPQEEWREATDVGAEESRTAWAEAARPILIDVAHHYHAVITYKELAAEVQRVTGIRTRQLTHYWIGDVLGRVSRDSMSREEPLLSALCVNADGSVGDGYAAGVAAADGEVNGDGDDHAAQQRLACYRFFEAPDLPAAGGSAALTPQLAARRTRLRKARIAEAPADVCPTCHTQLPATKVCDNYCT
jgi:hypothetical protein